MKKLALLFICFLQTLSLKTIAIDTIESYGRMMDTSLGVVEASYEGYSVSLGNNQTPYTRYKFKVKKATGISQKFLVAANNFQLFLKGGEWNEYSVKMNDAPILKSGDTYVIIVSKGKYGLTFTSPSRGVFKVEKKAQGISYKNFADNGVVLNQRDMDILLTAKFHQTLTEDFKTLASKKRIVAQRQPASSIEEEEEFSGEQGWILLALCLFGAISGLFLKRKNLH